MLSYNVDELLANLYKHFNQDNMILYVGNKAVENHELSDSIYRLPWSCVVTSNRKEGFGAKFGGGMTCKRYVAHDIPTILFNREELPIIQLLGNENEVPEELEDYDASLRKVFEKKYAEKALNRIMSKMDIRSRMIVIGYDENDENEIPAETFVFSWQEIQGGTIEFYGCTSNKDGVLRPSAQKKDFLWKDIKLIELLGEEEIHNEYINQYVEEESELFYKGKQPVFIKKSILSRCRNIAQLLTDEKVKEIRPIGSVQQSRWFYNFLNFSSDFPQWYGYLPQSNFYLERDYEQYLYSTVKLILSNHKCLVKGGINTPIILEGDPGSSKSIELAAIAYKIFCEQISPVIYINGENLYFTPQSAEIQILDELMQEIEQIGEKDTNFLVVWDSSSYRNVAAEARHLVRELENRGRKFVLVCSAYGNTSNENDKSKHRYYSMNEEGLFCFSQGKAELLFKDNCYYLSSTRDLSNKEIVALKQKARDYAVADEEILEKIWKKLDDSIDIFQYFYELIILLRPRLEVGLSKEQRLISRYVKKQFEIIYKEKEHDLENKTMIEALKSAGVEFNEISQDILGDECEEVYDLDRFNACVAVFSRFKLDTPYSIAIQMLCNPEDEFFGSRNDYDNYQIFSLLTTQLNYIHYHETCEGKHVFRFRNSIEAEIFLKNNQINEDKQIQLILDMMNRYIKNYQRTNDIDAELKESLVILLRMYGPNTEYREFWKGNKYASQHRQILLKLDVLANKVHELRTEHHIPDEEGAFALIEISFYREFFGNLWDNLVGYSKTKYPNKKKWEVFPEKYTEEKYLERLDILSSISDLALNMLESLELKMRQEVTYTSHYRIQSTMNSLIVELARISTIIDNIKQEFEEYTQGNNISSAKALNYTQLYPILFKAISSSPLNGYLYNALFSLFEKEYKKADDERKLYLLSEVRMIADDASTLEITSRGSNDTDELSNHIQIITQYSCSHKVCIDDIRSKTMPKAFESLFLGMLERNNASGICFVCQQELDEAGLSGEKIAITENESGKDFVLSNHQLDVCRKIVGFMNEDCYMDCVEKSAQALFLLLRVEWMLFNGRPLSIGREWQRTFLDEVQWLRINETCEKYEALSGSVDRPIVSLLYALSKIHINDDYIGAMKTMHRIIDMPNHRMRVPYSICNELGVPKKYNGVVVSTHNFSGFLKVDGLPRFAEQNQGVRFYMKNLGLRRMPSPRDQINDFELGLGLSSQFAARKISDGSGRNV